MDNRLREGRGLKLSFPLSEYLSSPLSELISSIKGYGQAILLVPSKQTLIQ
jgi:hypothetical protein